MYSHAEARYCYSSIRHAQNIHWLIATGSITNRYYEVCTRLSCQGCQVQISTESKNAAIFG